MDFWDHTPETHSHVPAPAIETEVDGRFSEEYHSEMNSPKETYHTVLTMISWPSIKEP